MRRFFLCFSLLLVNCQLPTVNRSLDRIIHGTVVDISEFPYQVGLVAHRGRRKLIICGGALIKPRIVFTAAHCTHKNEFEERENLAVLVGANSLGDPKGRFHKIEKVVKHPDFNFRDFDHDFSVVVLKEAVEFDDAAENIPVATKDHRGGTIATATGWGRTETGYPSKYLRMAKLVIESWDKCQNYFPGIFHPKISRNMICVRAGRESTYFGDSGGPLVIDGELVGLVSFGRKITPHKKTTVFTRVRNFLDFVKEEVPEFDE